jgi:bacterioferritin-associated ferredoxin
VAAGGGLVPATVLRHLVGRHGAAASAILARIAARPREARRLCACGPVTEAEVRHVVEHEWARTVADVMRRTRLGLGCCGGMRCLADCAAVVADATGRDAATAAATARELLAVTARARLPALGPEQPGRRRSPWRSRGRAHGGARVSRARRGRRGRRRRTAAAWAAARAGAAVVVVSDRPGASELGTAAVDDVAVAAVDAAPIEPDVRAFQCGLGLWHLGERGVRLATPGGWCAPRAGATARCSISPRSRGRASPSSTSGARARRAAAPRAASPPGPGRARRARASSRWPWDPPPALAGARGAAPAPPLAALGERLVAARGAAARAPDAWLLPAWPGLDAPASPLSGRRSASPSAR